MDNPIVMSILLIALTVIVYIISKKIFFKYPKVWLLPVVVSPLVILLILYLISIPLETYDKAVQPLI
ncbi:MAG: LrgB family protein, partial [Neisseriaceae bacterium]|nr:LrgB family protein [Neisseriaceae bacterium]